MEVLQEDYVRTARAKGQSELKILLRHALRNAAVPIVTVIGIGIALLIGGVVVTEIRLQHPRPRSAGAGRGAGAGLPDDPGTDAVLQLRLHADQPRHRPQLHAFRSADPILMAETTQAGHGAEPPVDTRERPRSTAAPRCRRPQPDGEPPLSAEEVLPGASTPPSSSCSCGTALSYGAAGCWASWWSSPASARSSRSIRPS